MRHNALRLSPRHQRWFYSVAAVLFVSGVIWLQLHWLDIRNPDALPHPAEPWLMKVHGAAAMLLLVILGTLIPLHIRRGWYAKVNRQSGLGIIALFAFLILSGYGLYYVGDEHAREYTAYVHDILGLAAPLIIAWHVLAGRAANRRTEDRRQRTDS
jgi:hypothetical protein